MKITTTNQEKNFDQSYKAESGWMHRIFLWLARKHINRVVKTVASRAFERGQIDSFTMHEMCGCCDRILWPKRRKPTVAEIEKILKDQNDKYVIEVQCDGSILAVDK